MDPLQRLHIARAAFIKVIGVPLPRLASPVLQRPLSLPLFAELVSWQNATFRTLVQGWLVELALDVTAVASSLSYPQTGWPLLNGVLSIIAIMMCCCVVFCFEKVKK